MPSEKHLAIKLRKFNRICPITGYREETIRVGALVIVQTDRGIESGTIVEFKIGFPKALSRDVKLKKVIRYATPADLEKDSNLAKLEEEAIKIACGKVEEYELPLKVVDVEYLFDSPRLTVYYRLFEGKQVKDVKEFARDLSSALKARIDLRQISSRDEARIFGGLGLCGRQLCCSLWLEKPKHVTVKMVKDQGMTMSSTKTSGLCGRLRCCLEYEYNK